MSNKIYCLKDKEKWKKIKELFPWITEKVLNDCVRKYKEFSYTNILLENPSYAAIVTERIHIDPSEIEEKEILLLDTWYPKDKFDGNPENFILIEEYEKGHVNIFYKEEHIHSLSANTKRFRYILR